MLRLPNNAVMKGLVEVLSKNLARFNVPVYDFVPLEASLPYVSIGSIVTSDIGTKTEDLTKLEIQINIWSEYHGKYEINSIAQNMINLLTSPEGHIDTTKEGYFVYKQSIKLYEAYPEYNTGYNGVVNLEAYVKNLQATSEDI